MRPRDANYLLSDLLEMCEGFFGGRKPGKQGLGMAKKVVIALSRISTKGTPYLRMQEALDLKRTTLQEFVDTHVEQDPALECDGFQAYPNL